MKYAVFTEAPSAGPEGGRSLGAIGQTDGRITHLGQQAAWVWQELEVPVIAAINGYCMAGGFELALQCDISIASERAVFSLPEVTHGFFPGGGACQRLPRLVGIQKAKELIFTGRRWDAQEAAACGMVNKVVPHDKVMEEAMALAQRIAANPPIAVIQAKSALNQSQETGVTAGLRFDNEAWVGCMHSDEWKEKLGGFVRKERKA